MALMSPTDSIFLLPETRDQPMHVGSLQLLHKPEGATADFLPELFQRLLAVDDVAPTFRRRAYRSVTTLGQWAWRQDRDIDLEHHVRHSALPRPGRIRGCWPSRPGCTARCSTGSDRCGRCTSSRVSMTIGSRSTPRCTTR